MRAGLLKEPLEIWEKTLETNDYGEETETWILKYKTRARLIHDGGTRVLENSEIYFSHSKTFQIRDYVPVDENDRLIWKGKAYRILNLEPDSERMSLTIKAELIND